MGNISNLRHEDSKRGSRQLNGTTADVTSVSELHRALIRKRRPSRLFGSEVWDSWRTAAVRNVGEGTTIGFDR